VVVPARHDELILIGLPTFGSSVSSPAQYGAMVVDELAVDGVLRDVD
jgi:hypothetical protein